MTKGSSSYINPYSHHPIKEAKPLRTLIWFTIIVLLLFSSFLFYKYSDIWMFYLQGDRYEYIQEYLDDLKVEVNNIASNNNLNYLESFNSKYNNFQKILDDLIDLNPADSILFFYKAHLFWLGFQSKLLQEPTPYMELTFNLFIDDFRVSEVVCKSCLLDVVTTMRKSIALELPSLFMGDALRILVNSYFWLGKEYLFVGWNLIQQYIQYHKLSLTADETMLRNTNTNISAIKRDVNRLYNKLDLSWFFLISWYSIFLQEESIYWMELNSLFEVELVTLWRALYFIKRNKKIQAYSLLQDLDAQLKNRMKETNSNLYKTLFNYNVYILGVLMGEKNSYKRQIYYYSQLDFEDFALKYPWFFEKFSNLLISQDLKKIAYQIYLDYQKILKQSN